MTTTPGGIRMRLTPPRLLTVLLAALALAVAGCGDDDGGGGSGGTVASGVDLSGASFTVGSKEFTEQLILGQITMQALRAAGAEVRDQTGLEGSLAARRALTSGEIDMYWEYTGTAWVTYLDNEEGVPDAQGQWEQLAEADRGNGVAWLPIAEANNTYAFAVRSDTGTEVDQVETLSDLAELARSNPELATLCVGEEFSTRPDGLPGVEETYGFKFPNDQVSLVGDAVVYDQVARGDRCNFGSVFATDGRIAANELRVLEDDKAFFPFFNPALTVRADVLEEHPQLEELFAPVTEALTDEVLIDLNAKVDVEGQTPEAVAAEFLEEQGIVS
jgi:osmoprotectant transport system substrate-binding protein